jgi:hypothetical protein
MPTKNGSGATTNNVINQIGDLPVGLIIGKSVAVTREGGMQYACATSHDAGSVNWYAHDAMCGPGQNLQAAAAHFGPFPNETLARQMLDGATLADMDAIGTVGSSTWLTLP